MGESPKFEWVLSVTACLRQFEVGHCLARLCFLVSAPPKSPRSFWEQHPSALRVLSLGVEKLNAHAAQITNLDEKKKREIPDTGSLFVVVFSKPS